MSIYLGKIYSDERRPRGLLPAFVILQSSAVPRDKEHYNPGQSEMQTKIEVLTTLASSFVGLTSVQMCTFGGHLGNSSHGPGVDRPLGADPSTSRGGGLWAAGNPSAKSPSARTVRLGSAGPDGPSGRVAAETAAPSHCSSEFPPWAETGREPSGKGRTGAGRRDVYCCRSFASPGARVSRGVCGFSIKREKHDPS